jgi:tetratricopeptide (TPR) repeat protein
MHPISAKDEMYNIDLDVPELRDIGSRPKIVLSNSKNDVVNNNYIHEILPQYDAAILFQEAMYGTGFNYMPTYEHLFAMYNELRYLENSIDNWKDDVAIYRYFDQGQYLQYIYYLKLWLGDSFDYRLWDTTNPSREVIRLPDSKKTLREALDGLNNITIKEIAVSLNAQDARNVQKMRDYSKVMLLSALTDFLYDGFAYPLEEIFDEVFLFIADHMKEAIAIFPQDLWAYYWLAYSETELGNYDAAIEHWEYIIAQPLSSCLETLPRVYQKLSVCYAARGDLARSDWYKKIGERLLNEHDLIVTNLNDVR